MLWIAGFLAFPIAGIAGDLAASRVDNALAAVLGGVVSGLVVGTGQVLVSRRRLDPRRWIPATAIGMGAGLLLGAVTVDYGTSLGDLALMGALTGIILGPAQAVALPARTRQRWAWAVALPDYSAADVARALRGISLSQAALLPELATTNLAQSAPRLEVPIVLAQGRRDQVAPGELTQRYYDALVAPSKRLVWFEKSAHTPQYDEPEKFRELLLQVRNIR